MHHNYDTSYEEKVHRPHFSAQGNLSSDICERVEIIKNMHEFNPRIPIHILSVPPSYHDSGVEVHWIPGARILDFGSVPPGLDHDEAYTGYDAWSLAHFGNRRKWCSLAHEPKSMPSVTR